MAPPSLTASTSCPLQIWRSLGGATVWLVPQIVVLTVNQLVKPPWLGLSALVARDAPHTSGSRSPVRLPRPPLEEGVLSGSQNAALGRPQGGALCAWTEEGTAVIASISSATTPDTPVLTERITAMLNPSRCPNTTLYGIR